MLISDMIGWINSGNRGGGNTKNATQTLYGKQKSWKGKQVSMSLYNNVFYSLLIVNRFITKLHTVCFVILQTLTALCNKLQKVIKAKEVVYQPG